MKYILLKTKDDFKRIKEEYKNISKTCWKMYMWDLFRSKTCYVPNEDCFISLDKAKNLGYVELV